MRVLHKLMSFLQDAVEPPVRLQTDALSAWRERLLMGIYLVGFFLGILAFLPGMYYLVGQGHTSIALADTAAFAWLLMVILTRWRLSYAWRAYPIAVICYLLGLVIMLRLGPFSGGVLWLFSVSVTAGLLLGIRVGLISLGISAATILGLGLALAGGLLHWDTPIDSPVARWFILGASFLLLNGVVTLVAAIMTRGLEQALESEQEARRELAIREKAVSESEARYRFLAENVRDVIWTVDRDLRFSYVSPSVQRVLGYAVDELLGKPFDFALPPAYRMAWRQQFNHGRQLLDAAIPRSSHLDPQEFQLKRKDGAMIWVEVSASFLTDGQSGYSGMIGITRDVTERFKAQQSLRNSEMRYRRLFNGIHDMICTHDLQGNITSINPAVSRVLGFPLEKMIGLRLDQATSPDFDEEMLEKYLQDIQEKGTAGGLVKLRAADGDFRYIEFHNTLVRGEEGEGFVSGLGRDVTERIKAGREKKRLQEQLLQSQKMEAVGTLAGGIAHDFNNILGAILGYGELALRSARKGEDTEFEIQSVIKAAVRARDLVKQIMTFSRKLEADLKPLDLNQVVTQAAAILERTLPKMITMEMDLAPEPQSVKGDPGQLEQVIINLANNARDAMDEGGRLGLCTRTQEIAPGQAPQGTRLKAGRYVVLTVSDNGSGMPAEILDRIFEPFFTTKEVGKGTGLGLSTAFGVVKGHGGEIACTSQEGQGSTFSIFLPAADPPPAAADQADRPADLPGGDETVLLVDDDPALRDLGGSFLSLAGYRVLTADSGEAALETFNDPATRPDLVVLDLGMPGMGGYQCLERIRELDPKAKVLIASGYSPDDRPQEKVRRQAVGFISKPYSSRELLGTVRRVLDQPA